VRTKPYGSTRKRTLQTDWLLSLEPTDIRERFFVSGKQGFYKHERAYLAEHCPYPEWKLQFATQVAESELAAAERFAKVKAARDEKERKRLSAVEDAKSALRGLKSETHGTVRAAALRAAELYLESDWARTLRQCVVIAAAQHETTYAAVYAYLAGVGVRVILADSCVDEFGIGGHAS